MHINFICAQLLGCYVNNMLLRNSNCYYMYVTQPSMLIIIIIIHGTLYLYSC